MATESMLIFVRHVCYSGVLHVCYVGATCVRCVCYKCKLYVCWVRQKVRIEIFKVRDSCKFEALTCAKSETVAIMTLGLFNMCNCRAFTAPMPAKCGTVARFRAHSSMLAP